MNQSFSQEISPATDFVHFEPRQIVSGAVSFVRVHTAACCAGALLLVMALQMFAVIWRKSITVDEIVMIPSAYYHLSSANFQLVNEHPPLSKLVAGAPLLFVQPEEARPDQITAPPGSPDAKWAYYDSFWENNFHRFDTLGFWARTGMIALTIGLGILVFWFGRELFGGRVAVIATALFALEPTVLAHGRVVQTDIPAAFGYLLFFIALYRYNRRRDWRRAAWLGTAAAIAILGKYSMLLVGLVLATYFAALVWRAARSDARRTLLHLSLVFVAIVFVVNAAYFFIHPPLSPADVQWINDSFTSHPGAFENVTRLLSWVLPKDFVLGILFQFVHNSAGHYASLLGMYSQTGWWYYFPVAFALKTTLPFLLLSLAALAWASYEILRNKDWRLAWLIVPFVVYTIFVLFSHIDIGVRYYLPAYPFLFIASAAILDRMIKSTRARHVGTLIAIALLAWIGFEAVRAFPNHVSYMNELASRAPHWWYLSDSNVEWGDDLKATAAYLHARGEDRVTDATLGGFFMLHHYGINRVDALDPKFDPSAAPRYIAVGASYLNGSTIPAGFGRTAGLSDAERVNIFAEYRNRVPEAAFGNSVFLFRESSR
jgi:Dolichyl-phosphate-mannose-protein mannosyltransferase